MSLVLRTVNNLEVADLDPRTLPVIKRVDLLVKALNGAESTNEALARCEDGEAMLDVLLGASAKLGLGLTREDLMTTPPIRDWIWWKEKEALITIGETKPRYKQDDPATKSNASGSRSFLGLFRF
ncbi:MAG: hypothetical protein AB8A40_01180 [Prochlorococcus sp.]|jgi:hypothetical protein|nr:hypothetical protein [Prochlorococcaceae cyanobacterium ETNP2_MAG_10]MDP6203368.1 hypothetical protein [Prochlorococcaceae cyanobacterium ETNP18_MAG_14]MDP6309394.1 hypothetical protein [Prochlorococcaceae cyanobacterium ETNP14_MAG_4]HJM80179.1 hypothetical protein [Prochlorococcaceae cyanobacterium Fu_MAG_72]